MTTESKKLLTRVGAHQFLFDLRGEQPGIHALHHDARLANEMLPVLRQLAAALKDGRWGSHRDRALADAAPFLEG